MNEQVLGCQSYQEHQRAPHFALNSIEVVLKYSASFECPRSFGGDVLLKLAMMVATSKGNPHTAARTRVTARSSRAGGRLSVVAVLGGTNMKL
jgi:hypothetical protein